MTPPPHLVRRLAVVLAATVAVLLVAALALPALVEAPSLAHDGTRRSSSFEELLVRVCALAALVAGGCCWAGVLRLVLAAAPGADPAQLPAPAGLPPWLRRAVLTACGVATASCIAERCHESAQMSGDKTTCCTTSLPSAV